MNIVITDAKTIDDNYDYFEPLKKLGNLFLYDLSTNEEIPERIKDADIIVCNKTSFDESNLKDAKNLKYIGLFATGYNNIDVEYAKSRNILVANAANYSTEAVAQHTFALILNHFNKIGLYNNFVMEGGWKNAKTFSPFIYPMNELAVKTLGIIGYGNIGRKVATIGRAFSMNIMAYTNTIKDDSDVVFTDFETLLKECDVISVHCPLNKSTEKLFNEKAFKLMKDTALFINTARGGIMDEDALYNALINKEIGGAAIDVLTIEPMDRNSKLNEAPNITITPHVAWAPFETKERLLSVVTENIKAFQNGRPVNIVNL